MKEIEVHGRKYVPDLTVHKKLQLAPVVAYGTHGQKGSLVLSVYMMVRAKKEAGKGHEQRTYRHHVMRETMQAGTPHPEQRQRMAFMCDVVATQYEHDYVLLCEVKPK